MPCFEQDSNRKVYTHRCYNSVISRRERGETTLVKICIKNNVIYFPPIILFYGSNQIGAPGFEYCGIMGVATNFALWFRICILAHELVHYSIHFLSAGVQRRLNDINDKIFLWKGNHMLHPEERVKGRMNLRQFLHNCWQIKIRFFPESI